MGWPSVQGYGFSNGVRWGDDCKVVLPVNIYRCWIGNGVRIGPFVEVQEDCILLDGVVIGSHSFIAAATMIGAKTFIGHGVVICNDRAPVANNASWVKEPVSIGANVSVGSGAVLLPGIHIGDRARIGAGAIVTQDVGAGMIYRNEIAINVRRACADATS